jgi:DNA-binding GntR family transcriptional regulator
MPLDGDRAFHTAIVQACGNAVLNETVQGFWDSRRGPLFDAAGRLFRNRRLLAPCHCRARGHPVTPSASRDAEAARSAMHAHMDRSHARFSASWRRAKAAS